MTGKLKPLVLPVVQNDSFGAIDPLDSRYYDPEIATYLSERSRIAYQARAEAALAYTLAEFGICSPAVAKKIETASRKVTVEEVYAQEQITKHDIKALVNCIKHNLSKDAQPYVHFGATSYDIVSTATNLQIKNAVEQIVIRRLTELIKTLLKLTRVHANTVQIGRTHGQHAVPITFGFAIAEYVSRLGASLLVIKDLNAQLKGKFSGAVGAYNAINVFVSDPVKFEQTYLDYFGLQPAPYSTQIVPPEGVIRLIDELTIVAGIMANLAHDMRHLQRSEIAEVREGFDKHQTGSSTMAHKRNPWNFENVISLAKQVQAQALNANLNISSEHQRDLTDSASSRFYGLAIASVASMTIRLNKVMAKLEVDSQNMQHNLYLSKGAIAAEPLYLLLEKYGHTTAHETAKKLSHQALSNNQALHQLASTDKSIATYWAQFSDKERQLIKHPEIKYTGLAAQKALAVHKYWQSKLG